MKSDELSLTRRTFLKVCGAAGAAAAVGGVGGSLVSEGSVFADAGTGAGQMKSVRTVCTPNCTGCCGMTADVLNGKVQTVAPAADYAEEEYKSRSCAEGAAAINSIYGPGRLQKPMLNKGQPGENIFEEVSWKEALDFTADRLRKIMDKYGNDSVAFFAQVAGSGYVNEGALIRLANLNGWTAQGGYDMNGDLPMYAPMTFGVQSEELESYQWTDSKYILIFGSGILSSQSPDAHFLHAAQKNTGDGKAGAKIICFDPHFCATAAKADEWYAIKNASDGAVALGMVKVILDNNLHDATFVKTYTDLPILIRSDNKKRLLARDVQGMRVINVPGYRECYAAYNGRMISVNPESFDLPANIVLDTEVTVTLTNGRQIKAKTAFRLLKEAVEQYTPAEVEKISGMPADDLVRIAKDVANIKPLHVIYGASAYQWYNGDVKGRALALLPVLTGNIGTQGGGMSALAHHNKVRFSPDAWWTPTDETGKVPNPQKGSAFQYMVHGATDRMKASYPENGIKAWIMLGGNPFDQHNLNNALRKKVDSGDIELVVNLDFQKTASSLFSHVLLPGVSGYEKTELTTTPLHPYIQLMQPAVAPVGEGKPEIWIFRELARRLGGEAQEKYFFPDLDAEKAAEAAVKLMLENGGEAVAGITLEQLRQGPVKMKNNAPGGKRIPFYDQIHNRKPFPPQSFPNKMEDTARFLQTGRIQFYRDEDAFLEEGEQLPIHREPFEKTEYLNKAKTREDYPFAYLTRTGIHRVHSAHADNLVFRELQNGGAKVYMNPEDAKDKKIAYGDYVEVYNERGTVQGDVVVDPGLQSGTILFEQGWEAWDTGGPSRNSLIFPYIKPTHEVFFVPQMWAPNTNWNECVCNVRKVAKK